MRTPVVPEEAPRTEKVSRQEKTFRSIAVGASVVGLLLILASMAIAPVYRWGFVELWLITLGIAVLVGLVSLPYLILRLR